MSTNHRVHVPNRHYIVGEHSDSDDDFSIGHNPEERFFMQDWLSAVKRPTGYRVGKPGLHALRCNFRSVVTLASSILITLTCVGVILLAFGPANNKDCPCNEDRYQAWNSPAYNPASPITKPRRLPNEGGIEYRIAVITDLDERSKSEHDANTWLSYLKYGTLTVLEGNKVHVKFDNDTHSIKSTLSQGGRAMELSDLKVYNGQLLSVDDRTGVVYRIDLDNPDKPVAIPWVLLGDGPGNVPKGFKGEWMTVYKSLLFVGGLGKEWTTTSGELQNFNPMWIKTVSHTGHIQHVDWTQTYIALRAKADVYYPGYMIHESAQFSNVHKKWFFLPRRASKDRYTEKEDERRGTNILITADESFATVEAKTLGPLRETRGFSAFQFIPNTNDRLIIALKSEEDAGVIATYYTVLDVIDGTVVVPETKLQGSYKYEGVEFI